MDLLSLCEWLQNTGFGTYIRESTLAFPVIEGSHLLGLAAMLGPTLMFDLRLTGLAWKNEPVTKIYSQFLAVTQIGAILMMSTGVVLFWSEAVKCYNSGYFRVKALGLVIAAINAAIFHFGFYKTVGNWDNDPTPPARARIAGFTSMFIWAVVVLTGRYTAYTI